VYKHAERFSKLFVILVVYNIFKFFELAAADLAEVYMFVIDLEVQDNRFSVYYWVAALGAFKYHYDLAFNLTAHKQYANQGTHNLWAAV
jgi:hypothetical protein